MSRRPSGASKDPDIAASEKALRRAARRALALGLQTGTPVYAIRNGQIVDLTLEAAGLPRRAACMAVRERSVAYRVPKQRRKRT